MKLWLEQRLGDLSDRCRIFSYDCLPSTNTTAKELAKDGAPDGSVTVLDSDGKVLFVAGLPVGGQPVEPDLPVDNPVYRTAMDLQPSQ